MDLNNIETEEDLLLLKEKVKEIEKSIRENNKPKTITISGSAHNKIKRFCTSLNLNIGDYCEKIILKDIENNNCVIIDDSKISYKDRILKDSEIIKEKYTKENQKEKYFIKANKLILSSQFKFNGYSRIDGLPIYEFTGEDMTHFKMVNDLDKLGLTFNKIVKNNIEFDFLKTNDDLEDYIIFDGSKIDYEIAKEQSSISNNFFEPPIIKIIN